MKSGLSNREAPSSTGWQRLRHLTVLRAGIAGQNAPRNSEQSKEHDARRNA
jgi:hypothetical protein